MKKNMLRLLLVLAGLLVTETSLEAYVLRRNENDVNARYTPNSITFDKNTTDEDNFYTGRAGEVEDQRKAAAAAYTKSLENKVKVEDKKISALTRELTTTNHDVQQIKKEHAELKNVERINE